MQTPAIEKNENGEIAGDIFLMLLASCGKSIDVAEWTEEVKLHSGEKIFLNRKMEAYTHGFPNSKRGRDIGTEINFADMGVSWGGSFRGGD